MNENYNQPAGDADRPETVYQETYDLSGIILIAVGLLFTLYFFLTNIISDYNDVYFYFSKILKESNTYVFSHFSFYDTLIFVFIGYILIFLGLSKIRKYAADYGEALSYVRILLVFCFVHIVYSFILYILSKDNSISLTPLITIMPLIFLVVSSICSMLSVWYLANGTAALFRRSGNLVWSARSILYCKLWITMSILYFFIAVLNFLPFMPAADLDLLLVAANFVMMILLMATIYNLKICLHGQPVIDRAIPSYGRNKTQKEEKE